MTRNRIVPQIDEEGRFVGTAIAPASPLESGVWHLPSDAVDADVPEVPEGMFAKWNGEAFDLHPLPQVPAPAPHTLDERRLWVWLHIKHHRDLLQMSAVKVGDHWFHCDLTSRWQHVAHAMRCAPKNWRVKGGATVPMTQTLAEQIVQATAEWDDMVFKAAEVHRAGVFACDEPEAYDWSTGWPAGYEGA